VNAGGIAGALASDERVRAARAKWIDEGWYTGTSLGAAITEGLAKYPSDRLVFASETRPAQVTLAEFADRGFRVARGLRALGLNRGDVVVGQIPQWLEQAELWYACTLLGLVYVPVIHIYGATELRYIVRDSRAKAVVMPDAWRSIDYMERLRSLSNEPLVEHVIVIGESGPEGSLLWSDMVAEGERVAPLTLPDPDIAPDDPCLVLYTSGTTAAPKGVIHTSETLLAEFVSTAPVLSRGPSGAVLDLSPAGHMASIIGVTRAMLAPNNTTVLMDRWDPEVAVDLIETYGLTSSGGPPFFLTSLLDFADAHQEKLASLQDFSLGGSAVPEPLAQRAEMRGIATYRLYGSTEHPTVSCGHPSDDPRQRTSSDGAVLPGCSVRIVDEDGRDVGPGEEGEILSIGPDLMIGYTDAAANAEAFDDLGYFRSGDLGTLSAGGVLRVTGRKKDIIIRGGENLSALEIEEVLLRHPAVAEAAVIAMPDPLYVERVCAVLVLEPGDDVTLEGIREHFAQSGVAPQKTPERLLVLPALPYTVTGKVKKQELRAMLEESA
jgi:acyl-coenzyme A synthetase/AMP-(fatty) acid ligase